MKSHAAATVARAAMVVLTVSWHARLQVYNAQWLVCLAIWSPPIATTK